MTTLSCALEGELISLKLAHDIPAERNSDRIKAAGKTYAERMADQGIKNHLVYIDVQLVDKKYLWTRESG